MSVKKATFEQLKLVLTERAGQPDMPSKVSVPNLTTALSEFLKERGLAWQDQIGHVLRSGFETVRDAHTKQLVEEGRPKHYAKNRASLLNTWHRFLRRLEYEGASITGDLNPLQLAIRETLRSGWKLKTSAREAKVPLATLKRWIDGQMPRRGNEHYLKTLEEYWNLEPGTLLNTLPYRSGPREPTPTKMIEHRRRMADWSSDPYCLKARTLSPEHPLRQQVTALVRHKVAGRSTSARSMAVGHVLSKALTGNGKKAWRTRQPRAHWLTPAQMADRWPYVVDGRWVPTAARSFADVSSFMGWALLPEELGGAAIPRQSLSLGLLADRTLLFRYVDWRTERAGKINGGIQQFIQFVSMLLHAADGFLVARDDIGAHLGFGPDDWRTHCSETNRWLLEELKPPIDAEFALCGMSRKPFEPIEHILELERPLDAVARAVNKLNDDRPTTGGIAEAVWARDVALLALLMSNPLRALNLRELTYRPDNTGQLHKTPSGDWRIELEKSNFKNFRGAAKQRDYNQVIDPAVVPYIERYLKIYRSILGGSRPELVFVSSETPDREWESLDRRVEYLTKRYLEGCPGVGPHALRHIVATHIIKTTDGNYILAALALHDKPATVEASYAHLLTKYADLGRKKSFGPSMALLKSPRGIQPATLMAA